jgi:DNA-binding MarR family transcriptional regulator
MDERFPLSALLSQALVAFIIEFDNEFEHRVPHRTTNHGSTPGAPWLVSMAMWTKFLRFVDEDGVAVRELQGRVGLPGKELAVWLTRLSAWWGYVVVDTAAGGTSKRMSPDAVVRPTAGGKRALTVWRPLTAEIEARWRERFGSDALERLRTSLVATAVQLDAELPDSLPIPGYGLYSGGSGDKRGVARRVGGVDELPLPGLLSKVLLAFAIEFEAESEVSLAICANVLRLAGETAVPVRELLRLSGVSKEAIATSLSFLEKRGYAKIGPESPGSKVNSLVLNAKGRQAWEAYFHLVREIETRWVERFGTEALQSLRIALEGLVGDAPLLMRGLEPYPDGWRAAVPRLETLPHYPMISHRGGFPDGS